MLRVILTIVQVFASLAIIGLVLLQRGKGAEAGAGFGAGASGTVFGARGASTALSRATAIFAAIFMINSLLLTYVGTRAVAAPPKTILDTIGERADKASATKPGVTQTIPAPGAPAAGETAPTSTPAGAGTDATASAPLPAQTMTPAPAAAPAAAPATAPAQPATGTPPPNGAAPK
jgi:preprotein translocase subunit SecG